MNEVKRKAGRPRMYYGKTSVPIKKDEVKKKDTCETTIFAAEGEEGEIL